MSTYMYLSMPGVSTALLMFCAEPSKDSSCLSTKLLFVDRGNGTSGWSSREDPLSSRYTPWSSFGVRQTPLALVPLLHPNQGYPQCHSHTHVCLEFTTHGLQHLTNLQDCLALGFSQNILPLYSATICPFIFNMDW